MVTKTNKRRQRSVWNILVVRSKLELLFYLQAHCRDHTGMVPRCVATGDVPLRRVFVSVCVLSGSMTRMNHTSAIKACHNNRIIIRSCASHMQVSFLETCFDDKNGWLYFWKHPQPA